MAEARAYHAIGAGFRELDQRPVKRPKQRAALQRRQNDFTPSTQSALAHLVAAQGPE